jgi:hypothetical protein
MAHRHLSVFAGHGRRSVVLLGTVLALWVHPAGCGDSPPIRPVGADAGPLAVTPLFVAVGSKGRIVTSPDGTTWTPRSSGVDVGLESVAFGGSRFVAVGSAGTVLGSRDGLTWAPVASLPAETIMWHVLFTGDRFVAVGGGVSTGAVSLTSSDGERWFEIPSPPSSYTFRGVAHGGGNLVAAAWLNGSGAGVAQFHSAWGGPWTMGDGPDFYTSINVDGLMVVAGGKVAISGDDGASWETTLGGWIDVHSVAFGGSTFVVVGAVGLLFSSPDARTWTARENPAGLAGSLSGVSYGGGRFVAVGSAGLILTSPDGVTWIAGSSGVPESLSDVTYRPLR